MDVRRSELISILDYSKGYYQIARDKGSKKKPAFRMSREDCISFKS